MMLVDTVVNPQVKVGDALRGDHVTCHVVWFASWFERCF